ncbi:uncharacterized protein [Panulirus ornatus]|uniref:uncharacterized protein n=1 Tax=Panulirus ornatus TaxID=150431 RepID=UPI003A8B642C
MSRSGSSADEEVKATEETAKDEVTSVDAVPTVYEETLGDGVKNRVTPCEKMDVNTVNDIGTVPADEHMHLNEDGICDQEKKADLDQNKNDDDDDDDDITIHENEVFEYEKESEVEDNEESCFKIDKVYSVASEHDMETSEMYEGKQEDKQVSKVHEVKVSSENAEIVDKLHNKGEKRAEKEESKKIREEKQMKPKTARPALAKVPSLTAGVGGVRMLGGGVRGPNMPLIVSMGAGNPGIPLLPAGLPPGRYVILPGTSTSTKTTTCATVTTVSGTLTPRLATSIAAASATQNLVAAQKALTTLPQTPAAVPQPTGGSKMYTRERGRRKSYTAGEKLAMIEAVEGGQRKSAVADRFGVAPSTLACILAQKHKIRAEQDNLARRRVRHAKYPLRDDLRGKAPTPCTSSMRLSPPTDHPFTHFLAPLSAPTPTVLDTQPEEIIAVPDLVERLGGGGSGGAPCKVEAASSQAEEEDSAGLSLVDPDARMESDFLQDQQDVKSRGFQQNVQLQPNDGDEATSQDTSGRTSSPSLGNQGLVGPYLLKKETHCSTVLDQLMRDDTYTDVTLTAEGQSLRAHRVVLCLASPYFRQVLSRELNVQSVVILRDIKFSELRNIIHFIYTGEATVDASELESFMRTAEMLEISSLCEGQKCITGRGLLSQGSSSTGFSIGDFERLVGTKRSRTETSPTPSKNRRFSGEGQSSRCSSAEPAASSNPLSFIKEEPGCESASTFHSQSGNTVKEKELLEIEQTSERTGGVGRLRRGSSRSLGGFAAIAGVQKVSSDADDGGEKIFPSTAESSPNSQVEESLRQSPVLNVPDAAAIPGRCPYCPHLAQKFEGVAMMRHLLVSHPCKPAFPCDSCWRVFVKRADFKNHQQHCQQSIC